MTTPRAVLHVGTMKTGTSTLQATLAANETLLSNGGFRFLGWPMRTSQRIEHQLADLEPGTSVIVSDEGLWHFCGSNRSDTEEIARVFGDYETTIVVYFRRPDEYVEAWFSQGLKRGSGASDLLTFLTSGHVNSRPYRPGRARQLRFDDPRLQQHIDLSIIKKLTYFERVFPDAELVVRPYERAQLVDGDIVADFLDATAVATSIPVGDLERSDDANVSPSADTVLMANLLRRAHAVPEDILQPFLRTHSPPAMRPGVRHRILRLHEANAINAVMRPVFAEVQTRWGGGAADDFFVNWEIDPETFHESALRDLYDERIATG